MHNLLLIILRLVQEIVHPQITTNAVAHNATLKSSTDPCSNVNYLFYAWLEAHSGLSHSYVTTATSTIGANTSSLNTNATSSSSSKG